jgi:hypothetical protein
MNKRWADMNDDDPIEPWVLGDDDLEIPVTISKHGIKVKKSSYVPPHLRQDKTKPTIDSKK